MDKACGSLRTLAPPQVQIGRLPSGAPFVLLHPADTLDHSVALSVSLGYSQRLAYAVAVAFARSAGLFAIRLPPNWTVQFDSGTDTFGNPTGSATETSEDISFTDPAQGDAGPWVFIYATPIHSDFERHWYCQAFANNSFFHSLPAQSTSGVEWIVQTANAHFQIDYGIPGIKEPPHSSPPMLTPPPTPTPMPPSTVATDQTLADTILGSFQPTNSHALPC